MEKNTEFSIIINKTWWIKVDEFCSLDFVEEDEACQPVEFYENDFENYVILCKNTEKPI